ncbi:unnamed protein product [Rotaria sp. Silwood1]|nr:unnamed protein product [Rotaria sp. Silwood1]
MASIFLFSFDFRIGDVVIKCSRSVSSFAISIALDHKKRLNFRIGNVFRIGDVVIKCSRSVSSFAISIALDHKKRLNFRIGNVFR